MNGRQINHDEHVTHVSNAAIDDIFVPETPPRHRIKYLLKMTPIMSTCQSLTMRIMCNANTFQTTRILRISAVHTV